MVWAVVWGVGKCEGICGDVGRYGEIWGDVGRCGESTHLFHHRHEFGFVTQVEGVLRQPRDLARELLLEERHLRQPHREASTIS